MVRVKSERSNPSAGHWRSHFAIPRCSDGTEQHYFCGNSLGLMPHAARDEVVLELDRWATLGVEGHFLGETAWMPYHRLLTDGLAALTGALPLEVVAMNTLTVNLQLLMSSFYRPRAARTAIVIEQRAFPSDRHAVLGQLGLHGLDPTLELIELAADPDTGLLEEAQLETVLQREGERVALVLWPGVQYATGQCFDLPRIVRAAHAAGAMVGLDLAHAVGNVPVNLHASGADFAVWCSYKYLNSGPGALAGAFVHERHADFTGPRLSGWWGHEQQTRFQMGPEFRPMRGAEGWQLSNPSILAAAPLRASLQLFAQAGGIDALRPLSQDLTGYLYARVANELAHAIDIITPADPLRRGCQLSLRLRAGRSRGREVFEQLQARGFITDWREPDVIRVAPTPLYNTRSDVDALVDALLSLLR
jgi:kynureninase